jgi:hypothetical protein
MPQPIDFAGILQPQPWTAEIHQGWDVHRALARDLFVAGLGRNGLTQKNAADKLGISPKKLTQHLTQGPSGRGVDDPARLEMMLDLSTNSVLQRAELRKHLLLAHPKRWRTARQLGSEPQVDPRPYMPHLLHLAGVAMHATDWKASKTAYLEIATASPLLGRIVAKRFPAELVELTLVLDLAKTTVSNRTEANLEHLRRAFHVVEEADPEQFGGREHHLNAQLKLIHALETTYRGLNLPNEAFDLHKVFQQLTVSDRNDPHLKPIVMGQEPFSLRSTIISLAQMSTGAKRFQQEHRNAIEYHARAVGLLDTSTDQGKLWQALLKESLARVYVRVGSRPALKRAERWLEQAHDGIRHAQLAGALHRTVILRSMARCLRVQGNPQWREVLEDAIHISTAAGLTHQLEAIELEFGLKDRGYS